jgi:hypothetical protein
MGLAASVTEAAREHEVNANLTRAEVGRILLLCNDPCHQNHVQSKDPQPAVRIALTAGSGHMLAVIGSVLSRISKSAQILLERTSNDNGTDGEGTDQISDGSKPTLFLPVHLRSHEI